MTIKTPFFDVGVEEGAKMRELFGYFLPWEYGAGHSREHLGTRESVSLCDLHYMGVFKIEGPDTLELIQKLATSELSRKQSGSIQYTAMCDDTGHMIDDCTIWKLDDHQVLIISGSPDDYKWIASQGETLDVMVSDVTEEHTTLALQGPNSAAVLQQLTDVDLNSLGYYRFRRGKIADYDCIVARMGYTGEAGFELHFAAGDGPAVWKAVMRAGEPYDIVPCGQAALESLRQEAGYLLVGQDHDRQTNPFEAGIGFVVRLDKDNFIGKAALQKIAHDGVSRRMVWLDVASDEVAELGDKLFVQGREVGRVTSASFSPSRRRGTAMAYVSPSHAIPGLSITIALKNGRSLAAKLSVMPLYDPGDVRTKTGRQVKGNKVGRDALTGF